MRRLCRSDDLGSDIWIDEGPSHVIAWTSDAEMTGEDGKDSRNQILSSSFPYQRSTSDLGNRPVLLLLFRCTVSTARTYAGLGYVCTAAHYWDDRSATLSMLGTASLYGGIRVRCFMAIGRSRPGSSRVARLA